MSGSTPSLLFQRAQDVLREGDAARAVQLLRQVLGEAPGNIAARQQLATLLFQQIGEPVAARAEIDILLGAEPRNAAYLVFRGAIGAQLGDTGPALADFEQALALTPDDPRIWVRYGHVLRTAGRFADAVAAYRRSLELKPSGEAWWALADTKTVRFTAADLAAMRALTDGMAPSQDDRAQLHFALGKALEDDGDFAGAFAQYERGNTLKRSVQRHDANEMTAYVRRAEAFFTPSFFAAHALGGCAAPDPIFVVGLPRSGSTLVEQILASHSQIEGTMELADMIAVARAAMGPGPFDFKAYPETLGRLDDPALKQLGETYIARTRAYRREAKPFFVDKMPNNFVHTGLIHLILPRARIVDVRRDPLACCVSIFKQHFAVGQPFGYSLSDLGRYYADYVRLMAHFDAVLPGRVHRVVYEDLVAAPEREIRRLFDYCGLPFEEATLRFHANPRAVRSASSEQVRRPINAEGLEGWRPFEPWLAPLKAALGAAP